MDPIALLLQVHKMCTMEQPITYNEVNVNGCCEIPSKNEELGKLLKKAFVKFNERNLPYGSVHADPVFWFEIFMGVYDKKSNDENVIKIPNGCCNKQNCPIAIFYNDIAEVFRENIEHSKE